MDEMTEQDVENLDPDPRLALAQWANRNDEWVRRIVRRVLDSNTELSDSERALTYRLFLEEKEFDDRSLQSEPPLTNPTQPSGQPEPFNLTRISNVRGVNALAKGEHIDFGLGLTLLFGENGAGKTGYARILKRIAGSRSADDILSDVNAEGNPLHASADIDYVLGGTGHSHHWNGNQGEPPFTLMSIFDSPSAQLHVDSELRYTYRPASLAIFDRVNIEIQNIGGRIEEERQSLSYDKDPVLQRFDHGTTIYPYVESLGPTTDLTELGKFLELPDNADEREKELESMIATLRADVAGQQIAFKSKFKGVLEEAVSYAAVAGKFNARDYNATLNELSTMHGHQTTLRDSLFAADLPSDPDAMWETFVRAGQDYRKHLETQGAHDDTRCLYCRQVLNTNALELIGRYRDYLEGQIAKDIDTLESLIQTLVKPVHDSSLIAVRAHCKPLDSDSDEDIPVPTEQAEQMEALLNLTGLDEMLRQRFAERVTIDEHILLQISGIGPRVELWLSVVTAELETLRVQNPDREKSLAKNENELQELKGRRELNRSWKEVQGIVAAAARQECLKSEREAISNVLRDLTNLSNKASEQLINHNFEEIFRNECEELRAPSLQLDFFGRQGVSQRKKTLQGNITPSRVLSEGEQKVIAIADFLAEARMSDNLVPVVFDDPVSSLDHRRIGEVARRIADLASNHQVVVFTHDIWLVTHLLDLFEKSDRCLYYQVTDDHGKGTVTAGTGPRWDTISRLRAKINSSIADAKKTAGEERDSHIRDAYDSIRSWCELFVEQEVLAKVTERYQPNVRMTSLSQINVPKLEITIESVLSVFEDACRYIEAHSQPLQTLGVAPKLSDLEEDWERLEKCRIEYRKD